MDRHRFLAEAVSVVCALVALCAPVSCGGRLQRLNSTAERPPVKVPERAILTSFVAETNRSGAAIFSALPAAPNTAYSHLSAVSSLGMLYGGARGATAHEIARVLQSSLPEATFHAALGYGQSLVQGRSLELAHTADGNKSVTVELAQALFVQRGLDVRSEYLDLVGQSYGAEMFSVDFRADPHAGGKAVGEWIRQHTHGVLDVGGEAMTGPLVVASTMYFWANWEKSFDKSSTYHHPFKTLRGARSNVPMMSMQRECRFAEGPGWEALVLPYYGGHLSMVVILPAEGQYAKIRRQVADGLLESIPRLLRSATVQVGLPRFRFEWGDSLAAPLSAQGMSSIFDPKRVDLGNMSSTRLAVEDIVQQTMIAVDESGTEAASATLTHFKSGAPMPERTFIADRPFIFAIQDSSELVLLLGQYTEPT